MTRDIFCDGYPGWADSTIKSRIYSLEDIGSGEEVVDVVIDLSNDDLKALLIRNAMQLNVIFTQNDYLSLDGEIPYDLYTKIGIYGGFCASDPYPGDQFDSFAEQIRLAENYVDSRVNQIHKPRKPKLTVDKAIGLGIAAGVVKGLFSHQKNITEDTTEIAVTVLLITVTVTADGITATVISTDACSTATSIKAEKPIEISFMCLSKMERII